MTARVLTDQETNTILHALRAMAKTMCETGSTNACGGCDHFIENSPLSVGQIETLCKSIGLDTLILTQHSA